MIAQGSESERLSADVGVESKPRSLCCRLMEAQEDERRAVAYELREQIAQELAITKLFVGEAVKSLKKDSSSRLCQARSLLSDIIKQVLELSDNLWPSTLDSLGLLPTLQWHLERYIAKTQIRVNFEQAGLDGDLDTEVSTIVYRIVQETLEAAHCAGASEVIVHVYTDQKAIYIRVEDNGSRPLPASSALLGVRERANALGGRLEIESTPVASTVVTAELPLLNGSTKTNNRFGYHNNVSSKSEVAERFLPRARHDR